jgi:hypothetical protein
MKIVGKSNYDLDYVSDILIAENVNEYYGKLMVTLLQHDMDGTETYYPELVDDDYKLYEWQP